MSETLVDLDGLIARVLELPEGPQRRLVALAGAPASGKSTLAHSLAEMLTARGRNARCVPMDGFHLDNRILEARGLLHRKGAPETFDLRGFRTLARELKKREDLIIPVFDRARDIAIAGAEIVPASCEVAVLEGNYLLYDQPGWRELRDVWDLSVRLQVPREILRERLIDRWLTHGLDRDAAIARTDGNDMPNIDLIEKHALPADLRLATVPDLTRERPE